MNSEESFRLRTASPAIYDKMQKQNGERIDFGHVEL